jgi:hypothetical protein
VVDVAFQDHHTIFAACQSGQLKVFDLRDPRSPALVMESTEQAPLTRLHLHPSQISRAATGDQTGIVSVYGMEFEFFCLPPPHFLDIRHLNQVEVSSYVAHDSAGTICFAR